MFRRHLHHRRCVTFHAALDAAMCGSQDSGSQSAIVMTGAMGIGHLRCAATVMAAVIVTATEGTTDADTATDGTVTETMIATVTSFILCHNLSATGVNRL